MSVLIKGVEMPTDHPLLIIVHSDGTVESNEVSAARPVGWQTLRNAAVPVPSHGRLIDADALRAKMYHEVFETDSPMQKWDSGCWIRYKMFERMEEAAPTIIPAEEATQKDGGQDE